MGHRQGKHDLYSEGEKTKKYALSDFIACLRLRKQFTPVSGTRPSHKTTPTPSESTFDSHCNGNRLDDRRTVVERTSTTLSNGVEFNEVSFQVDENYYTKSSKSVTVEKKKLEKFEVSNFEKNEGAKIEKQSKRVVESSFTFEEKPMKSQSLGDENAVGIAKLNLTGKMKSDIAADETGKTESDNQKQDLATAVLPQRKPDIHAPCQLIETNLTSTDGSYNVRGKIQQEKHGKVSGEYKEMSEKDIVKEKDGYMQIENDETCRDSTANNAPEKGLEPAQQTTEENFVRSSDKSICDVTANSDFVPSIKRDVPVISTIKGFKLMKVRVDHDPHHDFNWDEMQLDQQIREGMRFTKEDTKFPPKMPSDKKPFDGQERTMDGRIEEPGLVKNSTSEPFQHAPGGFLVTRQDVVGSVERERCARCRINFYVGHVCRGRFQTDGFRRRPDEPALPPLLDICIRCVSYVTRDHICAEIQKASSIQYAESDVAH